VTHKDLAMPSPRLATKAPAVLLCLAVGVVLSLASSALTWRRQAHLEQALTQALARQATLEATRTSELQSAARAAEQQAKARVQERAKLAEKLSDLDVGVTSANLWARRLEIRIEEQEALLKKMGLGPGAAAAPAAAPWRGQQPEPPR